MTKAYDLARRIKEQTDDDDLAAEVVRLQSTIQQCIAMAKLGEAGRGIGWPHRVFRLIRNELTNATKAQGEGR